MIGVVSGKELPNKNFVTVLFNSETEKYDVLYNTYVKSILAKVYVIDSGYDFGSISPIDVAVDMYIKGLEYTPGLILKNK